MSFGVLAIMALTACGEPYHLQSDFANSYVQATQTQADRGRASVAASEYPLTGFEGLELRLRVTEASSDAETAEAEAVQSFEVE
jgi:hypothetical protein